MVSVAEQLKTLGCVLAEAGWVKVSGNTWTHEGWSLKTGYVFGEATLELGESDKPSRARDTDRYYRGPDALTWCKSEAAPELKKIFEDGVDTGCGCV